MLSGSFLLFGGTAADESGQTDGPRPLIRCSSPRQGCAVCPAAGGGGTISGVGTTLRQAQGRAEQDSPGPEQRWDPLPPVSGGA